MIRILTGDLVSISANERFYYTLVLSPIRLFGGHWAYVFHRTSEHQLSAEDLLGGPQGGFHAFVDFIWAKRENRITRLARNLDIAAYFGPGFLKGTGTHKGKAALWFIYDMDLREMRRTTVLREDETAYPLYSRIDDVRMVKLVDRKWTPQEDERI